MRYFYAALVARFMHGFGRVFCFVVCCASLSANAQWLPGHDYVLDRAGNVIHVRGPSITTPSYIVTGSNTGAIVKSTKDIIVDNRKIAIQAAKTIPWKNVATGLKIVARTNPYGMAAGFAVDWLIDNNWRVVPCLNNASTCDGAAQWQKKEDYSGTDLTLDYHTSATPGVWYGTSTQAINSGLMPHVRSILSGCTSTYTDPSGNTYAACAVAREWKCASPNCTTVFIDTRSEASIRVLNEQLWGPQTYATYYLSTRPKEITLGSSDWGNSPPPDFDDDPPAPPDPDKAPDIWDDALPGGIPDTTDSPSVSGPSSSPGASSTTSGPNGSTTTNTVNNYTYEGAKITITQSTTTTTTSPTGEVTVEETVSDKPPDKEEIDPCKSNPDSLGCIKLGEVPDEVIDKVTRNVSVSAEAVNLPSQCPADIHAGGQVFTFDSACDFAEGVNPFVLAAAALMASLIVLRSIQGA